MGIKHPMFLIQLLQELFTLPFQQLIWDHITAWQLSKLSFSNRSACFPSLQVDLRPEHSLVSEIELLLSAHSLLPACCNFHKVSLSFCNSQKVIHFSKESVSQITISTNNPHYTITSHTKGVYVSLPQRSDMHLIWPSKATLYWRT